MCVCVRTPFFTEKEKKNREKTGEEKRSQLAVEASIASRSFRVISLAAAASESSLRARHTSVVGVRTPRDASEAAERAEASRIGESLRPETVATSNDESGGRG